MYKLHVIGMIVIGLAAVIQRVDAAQDFSGTAPLSPGGRVRVETVAGTLTVRASDHDEVRAKGTMPEGLKFEISGPRDNVLVRLIWPEDRRGRRRIHDEECRLEVQVPQGADVETESVSADVEVTGVTGDLKVESVSGEISVAGNPEDLTVEAVSGDITLDVGSQRVRLETVSGNIRARTGGGEFEASLVSGDVHLVGESFSSIDVEAVSGDFEMEGALGSKGEIDVSSHSGDVDLGLRGSLSAEIEVTTFSGSIQSELGGESERTSKYAPGEEYRMRIGDGSGRIAVDAFSGSVRLHRL